MQRASAIKEFNANPIICLIRNLAFSLEGKKGPKDHLAFTICEINIKSPTDCSRDRDKHCVKPQRHYLNRISAGALVLTLLNICKALLIIL